MSVEINLWTTWGKPMSGNRYTYDGFKFVAHEIGGGTKPAFVCWQHFVRHYNGMPDGAGRRIVAYGDTADQAIERGKRVASFCPIGNDIPNALLYSSTPTAPQAPVQADEAAAPGIEGIPGAVPSTCPKRAYDDGGAAHDCVLPLAHDGEHHSSRGWRWVDRIGPRNYYDADNVAQVLGRVDGCAARAATHSGEWCSCVLPENHSDAHQRSDGQRWFSLGPWRDSAQVEAQLIEPPVVQDKVVDADLALNVLRVKLWRTLEDLGYDSGDPDDNDELAELDDDALVAELRNLVAEARADVQRRDERIRLLESAKKRFWVRDDDTMLLVRHGEVIARIERNIDDCRWSISQPKSQGRAASDSWAQRIVESVIDTFEDMEKNG
jgi:hypothetical protein